MVAVDVKGYGGATDRRQGAIQEGLLRVLDEAAARARLARPGWGRQPGGDGELAVLPETEPEPAVVYEFPRALRDAVRRHNLDLREDARLRLRLAIHFGTAVPARNGYLGKGPVEVSRL